MLLKSLCYSTHHCLWPCGSGGGALSRIEAGTWNTKQPMAALRIAWFYSSCCWANDCHESIRKTSFGQQILALLPLISKSSSSANRMRCCKEAKTGPKEVACCSWNTCYLRPHVVCVRSSSEPSCHRAQSCRESSRNCSCQEAQLLGIITDRHRNWCQPPSFWLFTAETPDVTQQTGVTTGLCLISWPT